MTQYYLWLLQVMGAANPRSSSLIRHYGSPEKVYEAFGKNEPKFLKENEKANLKTASLERSQKILELCEQYKYRAITVEDADYPTALKNIYNPPIVLFLAGSLHNDELSIAVIGTREACDYSFRVTKVLCNNLAKNDVTIISGMAVGIDKTAHTAALEVGGKTAGVLACGFAVDYPKYSMPFREEIIANGGAMISELLPEQRGERGYFNYRNRMMSGLARGVLIVEAGERSGCHITAAHAINQNRDLFCVPPADIFDRRFTGVVGYLRDGATPVFNYMDILNEYLVNPCCEFTETHISMQKPEIPAKTETKPVQIIQEKAPKPDLSELSEEAGAIAELLKDGAKTVDYLSEKRGLPADELSDLLLDLEIDGIIESTAGSGYKLI